MSRNPRPFVLLLVLLALACSLSSQPETIIITQEVIHETIVEVTQQITRTPPPTATMPPATDTPAPEPTNTLSPIRATQQALAESIVLPTPSPGPTRRFDRNSYQGLFEQACFIVQENYVYGDFNGLDWPATCERYYELAADLDNDEDYYDLMEAFIRELADNHSRFVRPDRFAAEFGLPSDQTGLPWSGIDFGLGTAMPREYEYLHIWCTSGPAAAAGLERGHIVTAVDGQPVMGDDGVIDPNLVRRAIFGDGESGSVTLTVIRGPGQDAVDVTIRLGGANGCDGWSYGILNDSPRIGYIRIPSFGNGSDTNLETAIDLLEEDGALEGLVLDIRHNPGGNSDADLKLFTSGTFGQTGPLREGATQTVFRIPGPVQWSETVPMAVLINGNSHSAADYFAIAMQLSGRAVLVGENSAGNTESITGFGLSDGTIIRLAFRILQLPDGSLLEGVGVTPDILVPLGQWGLLDRPDPQLAAAIQVVLDQFE